MDNIILKTISICLFIIVIAIFIYMSYDYVAFVKDMKKESNAEGKLIKVVQKNYEYYQELNNKISSAINENSEKIVDLETSNEQITKKIQDIEKNRMNIFNSLNSNVEQYKTNIDVLNSNNKEVNKSIRFATICATAKKIRQQNDDMTDILSSIKQYTDKLWDILIYVDKINYNTRYRIGNAATKSQQHDAVIQNLKDNNVIIEQNVEDFFDHITTQKQFLEDVINTLSNYDNTLNDMNNSSEVNLNSINVMNTSNLSEKNRIISINNDMEFVNNTLTELENRTSNLEYQMSTQSWQNVNLRSLNQRANNLKNTIQNHFDKVEELSSEQSGYVNNINSYKTRMDTNENDILTLEEQSFNTSNIFVTYNQEFNNLNNKVQNLSEKALLLQQEVEQLESDWQNTSNQVIVNVENQTNINENIFGLDNAMKQYFTFNDDNNTSNFYEISYEKTPDVEITAMLESEKGLSVHTSDKMKNAENFKICNNGDDCIHLSIKDDKFYLSPESIGNFSIISEYSPLIDFNMDENVISLGKFQNGINNGLGRPMVIKDGFVHMDEFYVNKCTP